MRMIFGLALLLLAGCNDVDNDVDQCQRREVFMECLDKAPKFGSWNTHIVSECDNASFWMSRKPANQIKPECRN